MSKDLSCIIAKDLLPIYIDELSSEETNVYVKNHLNNCQSCLNEYKNLCEVVERKPDVITDDTASIKTLRKRITISFVSVVILGIILITMGMLCSYAGSTYGSSTSIFEVISLLVIYAAMYLLPLLGIFVSILWKKTIEKKEKRFWPNVIISFLVIWLLMEVCMLFINFFLILFTFSL